MTEPQQNLIRTSRFPAVVSGRVEPDLRSLNLEDKRRLRVLSARALSIVRNREVQNFETVMTFLDATHRLLPGLVPAIKHMKIQFGLKTMVGRQEGWS